ncbi:globin [Roseimaritima sediminicola]|uniref:globin n=1 Tax=Roseimaritima sediminicola TaxID=2662066 RepID=UPI00129831C7|nr:globin [Roseimaritima sediminicola]
MIPDDIDPVTASYHRCMHGDGFLDTFYNGFLSSSPAVRDKFAHTDFAHQKLALRESLLMMIMLSLGNEGVRGELRKLARRHDRKHVDVAPPLYALWLDALCQAVREHDPEYTAETEQQWRAAMQPGIDLLVAAY